MHELHHENDVESTTSGLQTRRYAEAWQASAVLHGVADSVVLADAEGAVLYVNPAFERQSGLSAAQAIGKPLTSLLAHIPSQAWEAIRARQTWRGEVNHTRPDGTAYDADIVATPIVDREGKLAQIICVERDITHLKELQRLKARFVTQVSNELRTPITHMKMYTTLLERGRAEKREQYLEGLKREVAHLEAIIEDLFSLSQLDMQDAVHLERREINLNSLVSQMGARFAPVAADQRVILAQDLDHALPPINANAELVIQALLHLMNNALTYTPMDGRVTLRTAVMKEDDTLFAAVIVDDTGPGITPEEQAHLFDPFFRGQAGLGQNVPGTGLGLPIVRQIAALHGGKITVRSEGVPGKGSTFILMFPLPQKETKAGE